MPLQGTAEMRRKLQGLAQRFPDEVARALYQEAEIEMTESKRRTPVDTGALRASGHVIPPDRALFGRTIAVHLVYGGAAAAYAVYVHEDLEALHPVGEAKFLESVLRESTPFLAARIGRRIALNRLAF